MPALRILGGICFVSLFFYFRLFAQQARDGVDSSEVASGLGFVIRSKDLDDQVADRALRLQTQQFLLKEAILNGLIDRALLGAEASAGGVSIDELIRLHVDETIQPVTRVDARIAFETTHIGKQSDPNETELREAIGRLTRSRLDVEKRDYLLRLRTKYHVRSSLKPPRASSMLSEDGIGIGPVSAPLQVVVFADFECPFCSKAGYIMGDLRKLFGDKARIVFRQFPLLQHPMSESAAEAALCAERQNKFWQMHDKLFANQKSFGASAFSRFSEELKLDQPRFDKCMSDHETLGAVRRDKVLGQSVGVQATPTFFINGRLFIGDPSVQSLGQIMQGELVSVTGNDQVSIVDGKTKR